MERLAFIKCTCKSDMRLLAARLKRDGYEVRLTDNNPTYRKQAKEYGATLPFLVIDGAIFDAVSGEPI